jgi:NitT/TauT family transport system permease protein
VNLKIVRPIVFGVAGFVMLAAAWELYKIIDGRILFWQLPMRPDDRAMPHVWTMLDRFGDPVNQASDRTVLSAVVAACWYTFRLALAGLIVGSLVGLGLAILMVRFKFLERAAVPIIILSQTIPIVAFAPLVGVWGGRLELFGVEWQGWMSVALISAFLAFAPVAVGGLRGLQSPPPHSLELMQSMAASDRATLWKLRLPASTTYLLPALRIASAAAVVGAIVAEISLGRSGGIGRLILEYLRTATGDPAKVYTALIGAAVLGLFMAGLIALLGMIFSRHRPPETYA